MMKVIIDNWFLLVVVIAVTAFVTVKVRDFFEQPTPEMIENVRKWLRWAVAKAEYELGQGTGALKLQMVYDMTIKRFPWVGDIITFDVFKVWVDDALDWLDDALTNENIASIVERNVIIEKKEGD